VGWGGAIKRIPEPNPAVNDIIEGVGEVIIGCDPMHIKTL
jgi:hypothetical protein